MPHHGTRRTFDQKLIEYALILFRQRLMEEVDHVELLSQFVRQTNELLFDKAEALKRDPAAGLRALWEHLRVTNHPVLHVINQLAAGVDDNGLVLTLCGLEVCKDFLVGSAYGGILAVGGVYTSHAFVGVDQQNIRCRQRKRGLTSSGESADNHDEVLAGEVHILRFYDGQLLALLSSNPLRMRECF